MIRRTILEPVNSLPMPVSHQRSLKLRVLNAGGWVLAGYGLSQIIRLGGNLVITRLLAPEMFGVMAIATMVTVVLSLLSDIGISQNIVQSRRGDDPAFLNTAWTVQSVRGVVLWLGAIGVSAALYFANQRGLLPPKSVYSAPVLPFVIAISGLSAIILGFQSTKVATAHRHFNQRRIVLIELFSQSIALVVIVGIGAMSKSIWALVAGSLVASLTTLLLSHTWLIGVTNRFCLDKKALDELIRFGKWVFVSSAVFVLAVNGDRLLLGAFIDASALGVYAIAVLILGAIEGALNKVFVAVSLPALSETARNNPSELRRVHYRFRVPGDLLLLFFAGFLFVMGQWVIDVLYDPRYAAAGGMLSVLALSFIATRYGLTQQTFVALGVPRYQAVCNVIRFFSLYSIVPILYYHVGTQAAIWGIALHRLAVVPFYCGFGSKLGIIDIRHELWVLGALPVGYLCGTLLLLLLKH